MTKTKMNQSLEEIEKNIKSNCNKALPWLSYSHAVFSGQIAIVGGAPSIQSKLEELKNLPNDTMILSVNGSYDYLIENGIEPDFFVSLDSRPCNDFVESFVDGCIYFVASQCNPKFIDKFKDKKSLLWHCEYKEMDKAYIASKSILDVTPFISGKGSVGLTSICLAYTLGFRDFLLYGLDSSFAESQHAYKQDQNANDKIIELNGFKTTANLANQVTVYEELYDLLVKCNCKVDVKSKGLIKYAHERLLEKKPRSSIIT